jgi:hypothetical protein
MRVCKANSAEARPGALAGHRVVLRAALGPARSERAERAGSLIASSEIAPPAYVNCRVEVLANPACCGSSPTRISGSRRSGLGPRDGSVGFDWRLDRRGRGAVAAVSVLACCSPVCPGDRREIRSSRHCAVRPLRAWRVCKDRWQFHIQPISCPWLDGPETEHCSRSGWRDLNPRLLRPEDHGPDLRYCRFASQGPAELGTGWLRRSYPSGRLRCVSGRLVCSLVSALAEIALPRPRQVDHACRMRPLRARRVCKYR